MSLPGLTGKQISHYRIEELIGSGGMGVVYRAVDVRLGRRVALKFLRPLADSDTKQRFLREAQAAAALDHPNICTIFEVGDADEFGIFIAMAFYEGETLAQVLEHGPLDVTRALTIAAQIGRGLAAAHEELVVHRDIKPANVMLTRGDTVKLLDFGLAKWLGDPRVSDPGIVAGTPAYMSPEQLTGAPVDQRTDTWSLGVVLHEMLTGTLPFKGDNTPALIRAVLDDQVPAITGVRREIPSRVDRILQRALAKDPRLRFEHVDQMVAMLLEQLALIDSGAITIRKPAIKTKSSIAVLPFQDMSAAKDQEYLCDGIAEELLRALGRIPELYVASRTSSFQFKQRATDVREIGVKLNVEHVTEGSVRRVGDHVRVSVHLISVDSGYRLWSERFDRDLSDIFAIEDEIAEQIAKALKVELVERVARPAMTANTSATEVYELYLQGRQFFHQHRRKALEIALQTFSRAIEIDPTFAKAYAGIADCHSFLLMYFGFGDEALAAADEASAKALALGPNLADAHAARGLALFLRKQTDEAEQHLAQAIALEPRLYHPHYILGRVRFSQGRMDQAATHFREASAIVPESYDSWYLLGMCYRKLGDSVRARSAELECMEAVKKRLRQHPDDTRALTMGAAVLAELGEPERSAEWVQRALAVDAEEPIIAYNAACVYVSLGDHQRAIDCLASALRSGSLFADWVANDPDLDPLRDNPRFREVLETVHNRAITH